MPDETFGIPAVYDTNILISALFFRGKQRQLLQHVITRDVQLFLSEPILQELTGVLSREKFALRKELIYVTVAEIVEVSEIIYPQRKVTVVQADPDDDRIIECALEAGAKTIVSGNKHLLDVGRFEGIDILDSTAFIEVLRAAKHWRGDNVT